MQRRKITIDEGNTITKLALFEGDDLVLKENNVSVERVLELASNCDRLVGQISRRSSNANTNSQDAFLFGYNAKASYITYFLVHKVIKENKVNKVFRFLRFKIS